MLELGYNLSSCIDYIYQKNTFHHLCKSNLGFNWFKSVRGFVPLTSIRSVLCWDLWRRKWRLSVYLLSQTIFYRTDLDVKYACCWDQPPCPYFCDRCEYKLWDPNFFAPVSSPQCKLFLEGRKRTQINWNFKLEKAFKGIWFHFLHSHCVSLLNYTVDISVLYSSWFVYCKENF